LQSAGVAVNTVTYNTLISACERGGSWREAEQLYRDMVHTGVAPDTITLNALISVYGRGRQWLAALELFDSLERHPNLTPDAITYNSLIAACARGKRWQLALQMYQRMEARGLRATIVTYNTLITACGRGGQVHNTHTHADVRGSVGFSTQCSRSSTPSSTLSTTLLNLSTRSLTFLGLGWGHTQLATAQQVFTTMQRRGVQPDTVTYASLIAAAAQAAAWEEAAAAHAEMVARGLPPTTVTYTTLVTAFGRAGKWEEALAVREAMRADGVPANAYTYSALVTACEKVSIRRPSRSFTVCHRFVTCLRLLSRHICATRKGRTLLRAT
jgi:pentatricopeptide repeat protein